MAAWPTLAPTGMPERDRRGRRSDPRTASEFTCFFPHGSSRRLADDAGGHHLARDRRVLRCHRRHARVPAAEAARSARGAASIAPHFLIMLAAQYSADSDGCSTTTHLHGRHLHRRACHADGLPSYRSHWRSAAVAAINAVAARACLARRGRCPGRGVLSAQRVWLYVNSFIVKPNELVRERPHHAQHRDDAAGADWTDLQRAFLAETTVEAADPPTTGHAAEHPPGTGGRCRILFARFRQSAPTHFPTSTSIARDRRHIRQVMLPRGSSASRSCPKAAGTGSTRS